MLYQYLTEEDKQKTVDYINDYSGGYCNLDRLEYMLRFWEEYKQRFTPIFGNSELRLTKDVCCKKSAEYIDGELWDLTDTSPFLREMWNLMYHTDKLTREQTKAFDRLISNEVLKTNKYDGSTIKIPLENGKEYALQKGCKAIKALNRISKIYGIEGFEDFQTEYSQIFNEKNLTGKLVISIHPLDYMTMSDNDCGWESCMSWKEEGDYRMGTVEMMNSPYVVVAYLESRKDMVLRHNYFTHETSYWNNKKWRELFIFSKDCILPIKGYPYNNRELELIILSWLKDEAKKLGWEYDDKLYSFASDSTSYLYYYDEDNQEEKIKCDLRFSCNTMYNDLCGDREHKIYITKNHENRQIIHMNFSGPAECMECGDRIYNTEDDPMLLICPSCNGCIKCADCGRWISAEYVNYVNGKAYCDDCYKYNMITSSINGDLFPESDCYVVEVKLRNYILENGLITLYLTDDEYWDLAKKNLIHHGERYNCWRPWNGQEYSFDKGDCIYLEDLDQVLDECTWTSYDNAIEEIRRKIEIYPLYYKAVIVECENGELQNIPFDRDMMMDIIDFMIEKPQVEKDAI